MKRTNDKTLEKYASLKKRYLRTNQGFLRIRTSIKNINKEIRQEKMNFYNKLNTRDSTDNNFFGKRKKKISHIKYKLNLK